MKDKSYIYAYKFFILLKNQKEYSTSFTICLR